VDGKAGQARAIELFQQKCAAVCRPELRKNKAIERFLCSKKSGNALGGSADARALAAFVINLLTALANFPGQAGGRYWI
jgi:hypothetical protein